MSYHDLSECTLTPDERMEEAQRICKMLEGLEDELRENELDLCSRITDGAPCSVKQLFWLRDIKDRVL